ncbi:hypothetical protein MP638_003336 [Amoeboaphelidium occidentale]|nr:hypothetical protein MP638_003336 [Amoeboaphelidium occidentale]
MNGIYCTNTRSDVVDASSYGRPQRKAKNQSSEQSRPCPNETCNKIMTLNDNYCNKCGTCVNKKYSNYGKLNPVTAAHLRRQEEATHPVQHTIRKKRSYPAAILSGASTPVPYGAYYYPPTSAVTTVTHTPEVGLRESVAYEQNWSQWHNNVDKPMHQQASQPVLTEDQYTEEHYQQIYKELKELTSASDQCPAQESSYFGFNTAPFEMPSLYNSILFQSLSELHFDSCNLFATTMTTSETATEHDNSISFIPAVSSSLKDTPVHKEAKSVSARPAETAETAAESTIAANHSHFPERQQRKRKQTERFDIDSFAQSSTVSKELVVPEGKGTKLGSIEYINDQLTKRKGMDDTLRSLHRIVYHGAPVNKTKVKANLRLFNGFQESQLKDAAFLEGIKEKFGKWLMAGLKEVCEIFGLEKSGDKDKVIDRIVGFLTAPHETKKLSTVSEKLKKKNKSKGPKAAKKRIATAEEDETDSEPSQDDSDDDERKPKKKKAKRSSPTKAKKAKKSDSLSAEFVDDSSDDETNRLFLKPPTVIPLETAVAAPVEGKEL